MSSASATRRSVEDLLGSISSGQELHYLFFWGHRPSKDGSVTRSCFSQWCPAAFEEDGVRYPTAEHYMMAGKARLFSDEEILAKILATSDPQQAKRLGRKVKNFSEEKWNEKRFELVVAGNEAKFRQHPKLAGFLLATADRILVEASPMDAVWGIGLAEADPRASNPSEWRGLNLLGFALMEVRQRLREKPGA